MLNNNTRNITAKPIRFVQLNTNRKPETIHALLNDNAKERDVLIIQEPRWGRIGTDGRGQPIIGPIGHRAWTPILPMTTITEGTTPRVMIYFRNRADYTVTLRSDIAKDLDLQVIDITQGTHTFTIVNIYNDPRKKREGSAYKLRNLNLPRERPTIITGDWNIHHNLWSDRNHPNNELTCDIVDWLTDKGYTLLNTRGEHTFAPHGARGSGSTIDLTFANVEADRVDVCKDWAINEALSFGSDHHGIQWVFDSGRQEIENITGTQYNIKDIEPKKWCDEFGKTLVTHSADLEPLLTEDEITNNTIDRAVIAITKAMQDTTNKLVPPKRPSALAKPWWSKELSGATTNVNDLRKEEVDFRKHYGFRNPQLQAKVRKARNYLKRRCKYEKAKWANDTMEKADTVDIWGFRKWADGARNYPTPAIQRGPDQEPAITHTEKCDAIRNELFQPPPQIENDQEPDLSEQHEDAIEFQQISEEEIRGSIFGASTKTAPGYSQIPYKILQWAWPTAKEYIVALMRHCLQNSYHPSEWKKAIAVALRKPGKPDYSKPRAYRLIQLLECIGKVLEAVVAKRLNYYAGRHNLIPGNQFGGRSNYSTVDAALAFTNDIQSAWRDGKVTTALTFDIKGYFDFVNHGRLLNELRRKRIPLQIIKWVKSFLTDRQAAMCLDGKRGEMKRVENGIPQGSPVSPILATFYSAELLEIFTPTERRGQRLPLPDDPSETTLFMYVDDGKLFVSSKSLETNVKILQTAYKRTDSWLRSVGLAPDMDKRELMHYTRRPKDNSPAIRLTEHDGSTSTITPTAFVKWLGIYFDRKLLFNHHVKTMATKAMVTVRKLTMLANTVRGLSQIHMRTLYKACVIPIMTYASAIWWTGKKCHAKELEKTQNRALRMICATFRTTPIYAMEVKAGIPPVKLTLDMLTKRAATRLNKLSLNNPVLERLQDDWRGGQGPSTPIPYKHTGTRGDKKAPRLQQIAKLTSHNDERILPFLDPPWKRTPKHYQGRLHIRGVIKIDDKEKYVKGHEDRIKRLANDPNTIVIYTDGSKKLTHGLQRTGAGVVVYRAGRELRTKSLGTGCKSDEFDAELAGIMVGIRQAKCIADEGHGIEKVHMFTDGAAAIKAIETNKADAGQLIVHNILKTCQQFLDENPARSISIEWVPGHKGITGNERADELAKKGTELASCLPFVASTSYKKRSANNKIQKEWEKTWRAAPCTGCFAMANRLTPTTKPTT